MPSHIALLRGINVGGKNKLLMKQLAEIFEDLGCTEVTSYIQSGNVVFRARVALARRIPEAVSGEIARRFGYKVPVVLRRASELREVLARNPLLKAGMNTKMLHVAFLATRPSAARIRSLDPRRSPPDTFVVQGNTSIQGWKRSARPVTGSRFGSWPRCPASDRSHWPADVTGSILRASRRVIPDERGVLP